MDEVMDLLIVVVGIIIVVIKGISSSKKVKDNAPGKAAAPKAAAPAASVPRMQTVQPTVRPTVTPTVSIPQMSAAGQGSFWQEIGEAIQKELGAETEKADHGKQPPMNEGDSRECEHGSIGGSMAYGAHEGGKASVSEKTVRTAYDRKLEQNAGSYRPAMNAQEMRKAVVMAEILKRPQERLSEQARRWSVR